MKRIRALICVASLLLSFVAVTQAERNQFNSMKLYDAGRYTVGIDIPEGEYILFSTSGQKACFSVYIDTQTLLVSDTIVTNTFLTVKDGDSLELVNCSAVLAQDYYDRYTIKPDENGGTLKVGYDIEPGLIELRKTVESNPTYRIFRNSRFHIVEEQRVFQNFCEVRVREGQYLELIGCVVNEKTLMDVPDASFPSPISRPALTSSPSSTPTPESSPLPSQKPIASSSPIPTPVPADHSSPVPDEGAPLPLEPSKKPPMTTVMPMFLDPGNSPLPENKETSVIQTKSTPEPRASSAPGAAPSRQLASPPPASPSRQKTPSPVSQQKPVTYLSTATPKPTAEPTPPPTPKPTAKPTPLPSPRPTAKPPVKPAPAASPIPAAVTDTVPVPEQSQGNKQTPPVSEGTDSSREAAQTAEPLFKPTEQPEVKQKVRINKARNPIIRSESSTKGRQLGVAKSGAEYELLETTEKWYKIRLENGEEGWITSSMADIVE